MQQRVGLTELALDLATPEWTACITQSGVKFDAIVHLAYSATGQKLRDRNVTTQSVLDAISISSEVRASHLIYVGSVVVYGPIRDNAFITESSPYAPYDAYSQNKVDSTLAVLGCGETLRVTVCHPTGVYDRSSARIVNLRKVLSSGYYIPDHDLTGYANLIHGSDLARAIVMALNHQAGRNHKEYIIGAETVSYQKLFSHIEHAIGVHDAPRLPYVTSYLLRWRVRDWVGKFGVRVPIQIPDKFRAAITYSSALATEHLGFSPERTFSNEI